MQKDISYYLTKHRENSGVMTTEKLTFLGVDGYDVYNISNRFYYRGKYYILGRVEKRDSEISNVILFKMLDDLRYIKTDIEFENLQDPFITKINDEIIIGGTKIYVKNKQIFSWSTEFYRGRNINKLKKFLNSPKKMKDVRIFQTDIIHVFTRPQGGIAKLGKIGYISFNNINDISTEKIAEAKLIEPNFNDGNWGGVNQVFQLKNGLLGILGHIAYMTEESVRHYYGMTFCFNPDTKEVLGFKIICERNDFPKGDYKRNDLIDVIFPGGLVRHDDKTASLYVGLSDAQAYVAVIKDPFLEYEIK